MISKVILSKIYVAKSQLAMDEETYRAMLRHVAGVNSAKDLTSDAAERVLRHLELCGFNPKQTPHRVWPSSPERETQLATIEALLANAGRPREYIDGMVKRICKVDAIELCDSEMLGKLIAAMELDAHGRRSGP